MRKFDIYLKELDGYEGKELFVEYTVTSWGAPESGPSYFSGGEPAEPPEIEIDKIYVDDREVPYLHPNTWFKFKAWLYRQMGKKYYRPVNPEWEILAAAADEQIFENFPYDDDSDWDYDYRD